MAQISAGLSECCVAAARASAISAVRSELGGKLVAVIV